MDFRGILRRIGLTRATAIEYFIADECYAGWKDAYRQGNRCVRVHFTYTTPDV